MALGLYIEVVRKHPERLTELDRKLGGVMRKCPKCDHPMLTYSSRGRQMVVECICPNHGLVVVNLTK